MSTKSLVELTCKSMSYAWGKIGGQSLVYQFLHHKNSSSLDASKPYAELWMGDHPSAPSLTPDGKRICEITKEIPYLFKILSVQEPLSLQCHPDLANAIVFHKNDPAHYPDPNHKPECGLFLTRTSLLYGVREYSQIIHFLNTIPEFKGLLSNNTLDNFLKTPSEDSIKAVLHELLELKYEDHKEKFLSFTQNYHNYGLDENTVHGIDLIVKYFPKDVGIFIPLILNVIVSEPGQALLIPTGTLHAYLEGDLIEAMALSDNVIRAAMTPKFVDVENLFKVMNFKPQGPQYLEGQSNQEGVFYFPTGFSSFNLESGKIAEGKKAKINKKFDASIIAVLNGTVKLNGEEYKSGSTVLIMPQTELEIESLSGTAEFYICSSK